MAQPTSPSRPASEPGKGQRRLDLETLEALIQARDIETIPAAELIRLFRAETGLSNARPDGRYQIDPRNGDRIIYNSSRSRRPHDNMPPADPGPGREAAARGAEGAAHDCPICQGRTTGVVDVAILGERFPDGAAATFINKNLFPVVYPLADARPRPPDRSLPKQDLQSAASWGGGAARADAPTGLHFLQWTSSRHDRDWHNMPVGDLAIVVDRLAALEGHLLANATALLMGSGAGYVSIIKNYGRLVGASLSHGHQQIVLSNVMPRRVWENRRFEVGRGETFAAHLLHHNPARLTIADYGPAVLVVPYYMRRPYDMILVVKDTHKAGLHALSADEIRATARGWHDATRAIHAVMPALGRELAYNVVVNNGPGAGLYVEFLPYTQEEGGLEKIGLAICQQTPDAVAAHVRELL